MKPKRTKADDLDPSEYRVLAAFRYALRRFLSFSEGAARKVGLSPQQYQALLAIEGHGGPDAATINELARQLLIKHHSAVGLVDRLEGGGLITRRPAVEDRRKVNLRLTPKGARLFARLAAAHRSELRRIGPELDRFLVHFSQSPAGPASRVSGRPGSARAPRKGTRPARARAAARATRRSAARSAS